MTALRAVVRGRVQGVGFRDAVVRTARGLGLQGWVRNEDDGSVRVHAEGPADAVAELRAFLHDGPPAAGVEAVDEEPAKVEGHEQFAVRGVPAGRFGVDRLGGGGFVLWLEVGRQRRAWAVPKGPSMDPADKRFAVEAAPQDGDPWDGGTYEQGGRVPWPQALERGHAVFVLHGERLQGGFALQRTGRGRWLLVKRRETTR